MQQKAGPGLPFSRFRSAVHGRWAAATMRVFPVTELTGQRVFAYYPSAPTQSCLHGLAERKTLRDRRGGV